MYSDARVSVLSNDQLKVAQNSRLGERERARHFNAAKMCEKQNSEVEIKTN